jgi:LAO/AO transport system kinase
MDIEGRILSGDKRAAARLISLLENKDEEGFRILRKLYPKSGNAYILGITGPPGAGKSTLTDKLVKALRKQNKTVAIVAVDPTSPFTGGAILGDRIRMNDLSMDPGVFIRSMGARGHLGGISEGTSSAIKVLDIMGADVVIVETVGVGQSEVDIVKNCDTTLIVMVPGLGDDIQAIKAGVMEIGDVFAINKSDRDGAKRTAREIEMMLDFNKNVSWKPPVKMVVATENSGIDELLESIEKHREHMISTGEFLLRRTENAKVEVIALVREQIEKTILNQSGKGKALDEMAQLIALRKLDPFSAVEEILNQM